MIVVLAQETDLSLGLGLDGAVYVKALCFGSAPSSPSQTQSKGPTAPLLSVTYDQDTKMLDLLLGTSN